MADSLSTREMEATRKANKVKMIIGLVFFAVVFLIIPMLNSGESPETLLAWSDRIFSISLPDGTVYNIPYDDIQSLTQIESPDYGVCLSGTENKHYKYGVWSNDTVGEYVLCNYMSFQAVIQVTTEQRIYWVGYESASTTAVILDGFSRELALNG